jgi:hypothetical protein
LGARGQIFITPRIGGKGANLHNPQNWGQGGKITLTSFFLPLDRRLSNLRGRRLFKLIISKIILIKIEEHNKKIGTFTEKLFMYLTVNI